VAFLYSSPAINVLAIVLTARILGWQLGLTRAIGAVFFAVVTGLLMAFLFRKDEDGRSAGKIYVPDEEEKGYLLIQSLPPLPGPSQGLRVFGLLSLA